MFLRGTSYKHVEVIIDFHWFLILLLFLFNFLCSIFLTHINTEGHHIFVFAMVLEVSIISDSASVPLRERKDLHCFLFKVIKFFCDHLELRGVQELKVTLAHVFGKVKYEVPFVHLYSY